MFSKDNNKGQTVWIGLSFLAVGLILGLLFANGPQGFADLFTGNSGSEESEVTEFDVDDLDTVSVSTDNDAVIGDADAPVTIVEFSDFQCPYCFMFFSQTYSSLKKDYIDTGKVKLVYRDFPIAKHPEADEAAQAAECVRKVSGSDEAYYEMHDALFDAAYTLEMVNGEPYPSVNKDGWVGLENVKEFFIDLAKSELKVDIAACLNSDEMLDEVNADYTAAKGYGISGTPTFFINGKKLVGAWPYEVFKTVIDSQL